MKAIEGAKERYERAQQEASEASKERNGQANEGAEEGRRESGGDVHGVAKFETKGEEKSFGSGGAKSGSKFGSGKKGFGGKAGKDHDGEVKEMWDTIAGGDSEV